MKNLNSFKTLSLLSVVGLAGLGAFSCKKETKSDASTALTPVSFGFKSVQLKLGGGSGTSTNGTKGRYDNTGTLKADLSKDSIVAAFADKTKSNYDLVVPTTLFTTLTDGGNGDCMLLSLDVESGATVTVSKKETPDSTMFSFGLGKKATDSTITNLPKQLVKDNGVVFNTFEGDAVVIQLNTTYANLMTKMKVASNNVVLTVTASKPGKASVTKILTVKGSNGSSS